MRALTILFVEDDESVRMSTAELLAEFGHTILQAATGADALHLLDTPNIDILMTDINLPDMLGGELATRVRLRRPDLPILFATGRGSMPTATNGAKIEGAMLLRKPFNFGALNDALRTLVDHPASG